MKSFAIAILLIFNVFITFAQREKVYFYPVTKGLSQHTVTSIIQDEKGFLWIGTRHGLNRFDGLKYKVYQHIAEDSTTISNSTIQCLLEDDSGDIWVGTYGGGLNYYDYDTGEFTVYRHEKDNPKSLSDDFVTALHQDFEGRLWIGTQNGGLNVLDTKTNSFTRYTANQLDKNSLTNNSITAITQDVNGNMWIGTYGGGLNLFDPNRERFIAFTQENTASLRSNVVRVLFKNPEGHLYVGTHSGFQELKYKNGEYFFQAPLLKERSLKNKLASVRVLSITQDLDNQIWIGTENEGLICLDISKGEAEHYQHSDGNSRGLTNNSIWSLSTSRTGIVWIGTYSQGLFKVDPYHEKFDGLYRSSLSNKDLSHNVVSSFAEAKNGDLWIGTDGGGLNYFDRDKQEFTHYKHDPNDPGSLSNNAVVSVVMDGQENLWVGTWEGGVSLKPKGKDYFKRLTHKSGEPNCVSGNDIYKLYKDSKGRIWVGVFRYGLDMYDPETERFYHYKEKSKMLKGLSNDQIRAIQEDFKGDIWVGTEGGGLNRLTLNADRSIATNRYYRKEKGDKTGLTNNTIIYLYEDSDNILWVGTEGGGVHWYDRAKDRFMQLPGNERLKNNVIYCIVEDDNKKLWMSTNNGLASYDKTTNEVKLYNESDGLQSTEFYKSAGYRTSDGYLLFGGIQGFNMFRPNTVIRNPHPPEVYITKVHLSNKELSEKEKEVLSINFQMVEEDENTNSNILNSRTKEIQSIELGYEQNDLSFEFAALNFSQPDKNQYAVKLHNYDGDWQYIQSRTEAFYTNVPPGEYVFSVKASNNDGVWNDAGASIALSIAKPWYGTYWAYSVYAMAVLGLLLWARRSIIAKERLQAQLKLEHVELTKMQELDQLKSRFFANISHEFRTPLTLIISPLKSLYLDETKHGYKKQIRTMIRNSERLLRLINQILDLSQLESGSMKLRASKQDIVAFLKPIVFSLSSYADRQYITYKTNFPEKPVELFFERDKLEKVFTNLLSNAVKYTPEFGEVQVKLSVEQDTFQVIISDTGIGIPEDQLDFIFNRFYRAHEQDRPKGTGIGLALTKELVELHRGNISVKSKVGIGTTFAVTFPLGQTHLKDEEIVDLSEVEDFSDATEIYEEDVFESYAGVRQSPSSREEKVETNGYDTPVVLIAEDNPEMCAFISDFLETNYQVLTCENGKKALDLAKEQIPDIIISDVMMPIMDGYQLCKALKVDEKTSHIPIILLTAKASDESTEYGFELGANYYVTKPFNPKLLALRVKNILESRQRFKEQVLNNKTINLEPKPVTISSADEGFIKKAMSFIEENIDNSDLQVEDLCQHVGMSKIQLYRKLKGLIGQSANEFIRTIRLKRAAQLLKQQNLTVAEVTYQVGFNDLPYFRKCFKKQYGMTPSSFAQQNA